MTTPLEPGTKNPDPARGATGAPGPAAPAPPLKDDLLDPVFAFLSAHPAPVLWLAAIPAALSLPIHGIQRLLTHRAAGHHGSPRAVALNLALLLAPALLFLVGFALSQAATAIYVDNPGNAGKALRRALPHTLRYLGICLWQIGSLLWLPAAFLFAAAWALHLHQRTAGEALAVAALAACIFGILAWLRNSLAMPAAAIESLPVRAAMRRSKALVDGRKGRIFKALVSLLLLVFVASIVESSSLLFLARARAPVQKAVGLGLGFAVQLTLALLLVPAVHLAFSLLYFEERARRGGDSR